LAFEGYCIGEPKDHWLYHEPDAVWFKLADGHGYVPSADITARPSADNVDLLPSCTHGKPLPAEPEITAPRRRRLTGPIEIAAAAPGAIEVGFAVHYADSAAGPDWHQIAIDVETGDGITARWDTRSVPGQGERGRPTAITVLVAPCLGLQFAAPVSDQRTYIAANGGGRLRRANPQLNSESIDHAQDVACKAER
jgi:hypothetical protein